MESKLAKLAKKYVFWEEEHDADKSAGSASACSSCSGCGNAGCSSCSTW